MPRSRNAADLVNQGFQTQIDANTTAEFGYLSGLTISRASITTFSIAPGAARNEDAGTARLMFLAAALTKSLSPWAVGNNNGGLDVATVLSSTWYHVHLIRRDSDGVIDALYSLSATNPTLPGGWTARRRLGSFLTNGSSQINVFVQQGDVFLWDTPIIESPATNPGTAAITRTMSVPTGAVVFPIAAWGLNNVTTANIALLVTALAQADTTPVNTGPYSLLSGAAGGNVSAMIRDVPTNTSAQVRARLSASGASDVLRCTTFGWIDLRGK